VENKKRFVGCFDDSSNHYRYSFVWAIDFENLKFEKPVLAIVYIVGNALSVIFQVKAFKKQSRKIKELLTKAKFKAYKLKLKA
jgi:hypothetical protein